MSSWLNAWGKVEVCGVYTCMHMGIHVHTQVGVLSVEVIILSTGTAEKAALMSAIAVTRATLPL